jgi:GNAT superfamily N-acetyltransferase
VDRAVLARLEHENMIVADMLAARQVPGAFVQRAGGLAVFATGLPLRLFNQVVVDDAAAVVPGAIEAAVARPRARGDRFVVNLRATTDDASIPTVIALGLRPISPAPWMPGMTLHPLPPAGRTAVPAELVIRRVIDAAGVADHHAAAAAGFDMAVEWLAAIITVELAGHPDAAVYAGYLDGRPVVAGLGIRSGRTIGVYDIATAPDARGRGYGAAMTMRIVDDGATAGCDIAALQASEMGRPLYERLGFRTVVEYVGWVDP